MHRWYAAGVDAADQEIRWVDHRPERSLSSPWSTDKGLRFSSEFAVFRSGRDRADTGRQTGCGPYALASKLQDLIDMFASLTRLGWRSRVGFVVFETLGLITVR